MKRYMRKSDKTLWEIVGVGSRGYKIRNVDDHDVILTVTQEEMDEFFDEVRYQQPSCAPQLGDTVVLKSGGPFMTVVGLNIMPDVTSLCDEMIDKEEMQKQLDEMGSEMKPIMLLRGDDGNKVNCCWFDNNGMIQQANFPLFAIVVKEPEDDR